MEVTALQITYRHFPGTVLTYGPDKEELLSIDGDPHELDWLVDWVDVII